jgi:hypothetical protein
VAELAELLDADGEGYVAAVEHARAALRDPERTPSAAVLRDLRTERATFFEYALKLARSHREYFLGLELGAEQGRRLADLAVESLAEAEALERAPAPLSRLSARFISRMSNESVPESGVPLTARTRPGRDTVGPDRPDIRNEGDVLPGAPPRFRRRACRRAFRAVGRSRAAAVADLRHNGGRTEQFLIRLPADRIDAAGAKAAGLRAAAPPGASALPPQLTAEPLLVETFPRFATRPAA